MKIMISFIGVLIILAGVLPFLANFGIGIPANVASGPIYSFIIIGIGVIGIIYGVLNQMLFGIEKFVTITLGLVTILGGVLPFLASFGLALPIPTSGLIYQISIIIVGLAGMVYGFVALG